MRNPEIVVEECSLAEGQPIFLFFFNRIIRYSSMAEYGKWRVKRARNFLWCCHSLKPSRGTQRYSINGRAVGPPGGMSARNPRRGRKLCEQIQLDSCIKDGCVFFSFLQIPVTVHTHATWLEQIPGVLAG